MTDNKQICGMQKADGTSCINPSGYRTNHVGEGFCVYCSSSGDDANFLTLKEVNKIDSPLGRSIISANELTDDELFSQKYLLRILFALIDYRLRTSHRIWSPTESDELTKIISQILIIQKEGSVISRRREQLDKEFAGWLRDFIVTLRPFVPDDTIKRVIDVLKKKNINIKLDNERD